MGSREVEQIRVDGCTPSDPGRLAEVFLQRTVVRFLQPGEEWLAGLERAKGIAPEGCQKFTSSS